MLRILMIICIVIAAVGLVFIALPYLGGPQIGPNLLGTILFGGGALLALGISYFTSKKRGGAQKAATTQQVKANEELKPSRDFTTIGTQFIQFVANRWIFILIGLVVLGGLIYFLLNKPWEASFWYDTKEPREAGFMTFVKVLDNYYVQEKPTKSEQESVQDSSFYYFEELDSWLKNNGLIKDYFDDMTLKQAETYRSFFQRVIQKAKETGLEVPETLLIHYYAGIISYLNDQFDEAREHFTVIKEYTDFILSERAYLYVGYTYENQNNYTEALQTYKKFAESYPNSFYIPLALYHAGRCHELNNEFDKAIETYTSIKENTMYLQMIQDIAQTTDLTSRINHALRRAKVSQNRVEKGLPSFFDIEMVDAPPSLDDIDTAGMNIEGLQDGAKTLPAQDANNQNANEAASDVLKRLEEEAKAQIEEEKNATQEVEAEAEAEQTLEQAPETKPKNQKDTVEESAITPEEQENTPNQ